MKTKQQCFDEIMDWFDFDYVYKCMMVDPNKSWWLSSEQDPCVAHVRQFVRECMERAHQDMLSKPNKEGGYYTGGIRVLCADDPEHGLGFSVEFVGTDWSTWG